MPLGKVSSEHGERLVGVQASETFFTYITGRSRYGKTETAVTMFTHLVRSGHGGLFIDPHRDALARIKPHLDRRRASRPGGRDRPRAGRRRRQPAWNLFELRGSSAREAEARVDAVVDAFAAAIGWGEASTRAINLTTQAAGRWPRSPGHPAKLAPTIFQIPTLLADERWREAVLPFLPGPVRASGRALSPPRARGDHAGDQPGRPPAGLRGDDRPARQSEGSFSVREAMDEGLIVLLCPGPAGARAADRQPRRLRRPARRPLAGRARAGGAQALRLASTRCRAMTSGSLAALLEQAAKFGLGAIYLNQNPERLRPATLAALTTNRSHLLASTLNSRAAGLIARELGGDLDAGALTRLPALPLRRAGHRRRRAVARPSPWRGPGRGCAWARGRRVGPPCWRRRSRASGRGRKVVEAIERLETLDERILAVLLERSTGGFRRRRRGGRVVALSEAAVERGGLGHSFGGGAPWVEVLASLAQRRGFAAAQVRAMHLPANRVRWAQRLLVGLEREGLAARAPGHRAERVWFITERGVEAVRAAGALEAEPPLLERALGIGAADGTYPRRQRGRDGQRARRPASAAMASERCPGATRCPIR